MKTLVKNKRVAALAGITAAVVVGSGVVIEKMSQTSHVNNAMKPITIVKAVPAPKKIAVPDALVTKAPSLKKYLSEKIKADKSLAPKVKTALLSDFGNYNAYLSNQKNQTDYLQYIDKMSMSLHKLTLQNEIQQQQVAIAKANADLASSKATTANATAKYDAVQSKVHPFAKKADFSSPEYAKVKMIFQKRHQYVAILSLNGDAQAVSKGSVVFSDNDQAKVMSVSAQDVLLQTKKTHQFIQLSLASKMENI